MLLPFDIHPDRLGWSVIEIATNRPVSLDEVTLVGLSFEDAEQLVNAFNALELRCTNLARERVLDDLGITPQRRLATNQAWTRAALNGTVPQAKAA